MEEGLPDFRNLGTVLRVLLLAEGAKLIALYARSYDGLDGVLRMAESGLAFELTLMSVVLMLFVVSPLLLQISYERGVRAVLVLVSFVAAGADIVLAGWSAGTHAADPFRSLIIAGTLAGAILVYFDWYRRRLSPALAKSRLAALQARIRPHFLFNSLNTAISVVRHNSALAETVLLDMADLFRVVLAEPRALVTLDYEIRVARAYLEIERVRLGDRLAIRWEVDDVPMNAQVPVLLLQPLVENAVWHGIEPLEAGGEISVRIQAHGRTLEIEVRNPVVETRYSRQGGNRLALANIEERLLLHFDAEAQLRVVRNDKEFVVRVRFPLQLDSQALARENVPSRPPV